MLLPSLYNRHHCNLIQFWILSRCAKYRILKIHMFMYSHSHYWTVKYAGMYFHNNRRPHANLSNAVSTQSKWYMHRYILWNIIRVSWTHPIELWSGVMESGHAYNAKWMQSFPFINQSDLLFVLMESVWIVQSKHLI